MVELLASGKVIGQWSSYWLVVELLASSKVIVGRIALKAVIIANWVY